MRAIEPASGALEPLKLLHRTDLACYAGLLVGESGMVLFANQQLRSLFGYAKLQCTGHPKLKHASLVCASHPR